MSFKPEKLTGTHLRAARALVGMTGEELAEETSLGLSTIRRAEAVDEFPQITKANAALLVKTFEAKDVVFLDDDADGGIGVRKRKMS